MYYGFEEDKSKHNSGIIYEYVSANNTKTLGQILNEMYNAVNFKADRFYKIAISYGLNESSPTRYYDCYYNSGSNVDFSMTYTDRNVSLITSTTYYITIGENQTKIGHNTVGFYIEDKTIFNLTWDVETDRTKQYVSLRLYEL